MFYSTNQNYILLNNSNEQILPAFSNNEDGIDNTLTPISGKVKKSSLRHSHSDERNKNRASSDKSVVIVENIDLTLPHFNLKEGEAIELISFRDESKEYELNQNAIDVFMKYDGFCGCVFIYGEKSSGKSFIMNSLMGGNLKKGFPLNQSKANSDGFRIYMYSEPYFHEPENLYIFFLDSAYSSSNLPESMSPISMLFTLANLIPSLLLINNLGGISETALKQFGFINSLQENIILAQDEKDLEPRNDFMNYCLPKIIWLFRDHNFKSENDLAANHEISPFQKLHLFLNDPDTKHRISSHIKTCILDTYKDIDCVLIPKPDFSSARMNKAWQNGLNSLKEKILQKITAKSINGTKLKCRMFSSLLHYLIEELNENYVFNLNYAMEYIMENECISGYNSALETYHEALKSQFQNDEEVRDKTMETFYSFALFCEKTKLFIHYKNKLKKFIDEKENLAFLANDKLSEENSREEFSKCFGDFENSFQTGYYTTENYKEFIQNFNEALDNYNMNTIGERKLAVLSENIINIQERAFTHFIELLKNELHNKKIGEELRNQRRIYEDREKEQLRNINYLETACKKTEETNIEIENELKTFREEYKKVQRELAECKKNNDVLNEKLITKKKLTEIRAKKINDLKMKRQEFDELVSKISKKNKCCGKK